ncbi:hypothetical protein [Curtobacterium sp. VKM Ac-2922]|uniref:hypothetical protein n=1 Tax=Curtobacterium sp. VKM Ac-2922 TaxID=2929475 RepID=UPI001FB30CC3|nr:hypothetical protein [Curtobacterium sp. VKM Ac-2922]MCJ1713771.1 hypothetical protein [Curtobacterium sp. VKM Ac-2922]
MRTRRPARAISVAALAVPALLVLAACSGSGGGSPTPTPSTTAGVVGQRVDQTCAQLLPAATFDVYGKPFTLDRSAKPAKGSPAARIAQQRGRVCVFHEDADPSVTVTLAVAHLPEKSLTNLKDALFERGGSVPTYTVEGYFALTDGTGRADAFADPYWITTSSTLFTEPGTAQPVVDAVRQALTPSASATPAG